MTSSSSSTGSSKNAPKPHWLLVTSIYWLKTGLGVPDFTTQPHQLAYLPYFFLNLRITTFRIRICNKYSGGIALEVLETNALLHKRVFSGSVRQGVGNLTDLASHETQSSGLHS